MPVRRTRTPAERDLLEHAARLLLQRIPQLTDEVLAEIETASGPYREVLPPNEFWESVSSALRLGIEVMADPQSGRRRDLEHAESTGRLRAEQGLPLDDLLHAYRQAGYLTWEALLEIAAQEGPETLHVVMHSATEMWAAVDRQAAAAADAYRATAQDLLRRTDERVQALLDALLEGNETPGLAQRAAAALDLPLQGRYAVVVLRAEPRGRKPRLHRVPEAGGMRLVWRMRADCEIGVIWLAGEEPRALAAELEARGLSPGGLSPVVGTLTELARARQLAEIALRTCGPDDDRVVRLDERLPSALVVSQPELAGRLVADVLGPLLEQDAPDRAVLLDTLEVWLECGGSAGQAASRLYCHRNTVFNRLRRIEQLTCRSLSRPRDLTEVTLALDAYRLSSEQ
ncbi:helix-turn-helix domain-containing protein [Streptomyces sp. ACA25]|uniref:PucR family transcriptional regulator n=1 Tax=Streptomyces sp. ACA25 TaxID=3022596 RepID=UPI00230833B3|nr:helix-turn-helix domain-containing protein [Streptomyces sp. ACA25]MDB1089245.1 helix-turn-helix domain-containing protein [Streptomyces sp. ACA25]